MNQVNPTRIKFYEFLNGDIDKIELENWVYETKELKKELPDRFYVDLISFAFKTGDPTGYIRNLVDLFFDWQEYEKWRTIKLLSKLIHEEIETVLATRKLKQLYHEQEERIKWPFISVELGLGFESTLDGCPIEEEYQNWNKDALEKQLEVVVWYQHKIKNLARQELMELTNTDSKSIDMGQITSNKHLHELFWKTLRFPGYYGQNWDALWDSITGLVEMPRQLVLHNWTMFEAKHPKDANALKTIIEEYNEAITGHSIDIIAGSNS